MNKKPPHLKASAQQMSRRNMLKGMASIGILTLVAPLSLSVMAQDSAPADPITLFTLISERLTQHQGLSPILSERFFQTLLEHNPRFEANLQVLAKEMAQIKTQLLATTLTPASQQTAKTIVSAWYTGIVGSGTEAQVITYRHALQFQAVDDVLEIRSYCPNKPGFWAEKPIERKV
ncbi:sugar dehydrogenase complex small subunit [Vibrio sp. FJH11]